jgi:hypothetical protein
MGKLNLGHLSPYVRSVFDIEYHITSIKGAIASTQETTTPGRNIKVPVPTRKRRKYDLWKEFGWAGFLVTSWQSGGRKN